MPRPVPRIEIVSPGAPGASVAGPQPAPFLVKMPKLDSTTFIGNGALLSPLYVTVSETSPFGDEAGKMASIRVALV